ncbi:hypothetical protein DXG03_005112 [Asterophora parasitica]|uniref:Uncharacterized protein n=1 Tax=Asterophora parasitica TaxID=117018 RepID=A0A9P7K7P0_9AGAR|nr:hypothetical protein DXG03_005112 [Asterophora parasitica]
MLVDIYENSEAESRTLMLVHKVAANCITLHRSIVSSFEDNSLTIDPEDGHRILYFYKFQDGLDPDRDRFKKHLVRPDLNGASDSDVYFKCHLARFLVGNIEGGDPSNDFNIRDLANFAIATKSMTWTSLTKTIRFGKRENPLSG